MTENLLSPFNGQLNLRDAYNWDRNQVYNFLQDAVNNHANYGVLADRVAELTSIKDHLLRLSFPNGADFCGRVNLRPDQHIYRRANPAWIPDRPDRPRRGNRPPLPPQPLATISKFRLRRYLHNDRDYWSPYDLLGLFLSFMGSAPAGATKRNFYLPMTAVYGRWCRQIAGSLPHNSICDIPFMFQCTWCIPSGDSGQPTRFFLGSSLAGYHWDPKLTGTWELILRRARFDLVDGGPLRQAGYDFDNSPVIDQSMTGGGTRFGNCAETYPFLDLLINHNPDEETCYGLALQRKYIDTDNYQDMRSGDVWEALRNPCDNCKALITWYGGDIDHFRWWTESDGAPP